MFSLLIKGTIVDAERALVLHGFHPSDWLSQPTMAVSTQAHTACIVNVTDETEPGVTRWFAELPSLSPFPVGTLLHYTRSMPSDALSIYAAHNAKAKELFNDAFQGNPPGQRPEWESQPLESRVEWLNKAARLLATEKLNSQLRTQV